MKDDKKDFIMFVIFLVGSVMLLTMNIIGSAISWAFSETTASIIAVVWFSVSLFLIAIPGSTAFASAAEAFIDFIQKN